LQRLSGRTALVTGGSRGIGRAVAERLASEGATVIVADLDHVVGAEVVATLEGHGSRAAFQHLDVVVEDDWRRVIDWVLAEFGSLDILVNNAGVSSDGSVIETATLQEWERVVGVNQTGVFLGLKTAAPALLRCGQASAINISSICGSSGGTGSSPAYYASKGAVRTLTKNAAMRWAKQGVRVNSVHPGYIDTPMLQGSVSSSPEVLDSILASTPMARLGRPQEVAAGVAYLASDDAAFVTGIELYIDGGYMAR
jgi:NAD(P)-dependent dehydrogenase (short-subunit alcohol dehydrogenase family)